MAHFAKLDENNIVLEVIVVHNNELLDANGVEQEQKGIDFLINLFSGGKWVQTSYNNSFRKMFGRVGYKYYEDTDVFMPIQPYPSFVFNEDALLWEEPFSAPRDGKYYEWDETILNWKEVIQ